MKIKFYTILITIICTLFLLVGCSQASAQSSNEEISTTLHIYPENTIFKNEPFSLYLTLENNGKHTLTQKNLKGTKITLNGFSSSDFSKGKKHCFPSCFLHKLTSENQLDGSIEEVLLEDVIYKGIVPPSNKKTVSTTVEYPYIKKLAGTYCLSSEKEGICSPGSIKYQTQKGGVFTIGVDTKTSKTKTVFEIKIKHQGKGEIIGNKINVFLDFGLSFNEEKIRCSSGISGGITSNEGRVYAGEVKLNKGTQEKTVTCIAQNTPQESFQKDFIINLKYKYKTTQTQVINILG